jgi:TRAP-type C4-dicarboxylate transport system permease small subunit
MMTRLEEIGEKTKRLFRALDAVAIFCILMIALFFMAAWAVKWLDQNVESLVDYFDNLTKLMNAALPICSALIFMAIGGIIAYVIKESSS